MSLLALAAGFYENLPDDAPAAIVDRLAAEAADFLRAGGALSLTDWRLLSETERRAFVAGGNAVAAERAAAVGLATMSPGAAAAVGSLADGGDGMRDLSLSSVLSLAARRVKDEPSVPAEVGS